MHLRLPADDANTTRQPSQLKARSEGFVSIVTSQHVTCISETTVYPRLILRTVRVLKRNPPFSIRHREPDDVSFIFSDGKRLSVDGVLGL